MKLIRTQLKRGYRITKYVFYKETLITPLDHVRTFIGAFLGIGIIGLVQNEIFLKSDPLFLIGSFGASAVLIFGASNSPMAQPRNLILGHVISALIGVSFHKLIPNELWLSSSLAVATSIVVMQMTKSMHPPGGATALIANIGSEKIKALGYLYVVSPVLSGVFILLLVSIIVNKESKDKKGKKSKNPLQMIPVNYKKISIPQKQRLVYETNNSIPEEKQNHSILVSNQMATSEI